MRTEMAKTKAYYCVPVLFSLQERKICRQKLIYSDDHVQYYVHSVFLCLIAQQKCSNFHETKLLCKFTINRRSKLIKQFFVDCIHAREINL